MAFYKQARVKPEAVNQIVFSPTFERKKYVKYKVYPLDLT
jgi:hypothetical protein